MWAAQLCAPAMRLSTLLEDWTEIRIFFTGFYGCQVKYIIPPIENCCRMFHICYNYKFRPGICLYHQVKGASHSHHCGTVLNMPIVLCMLMS